MVTISGQYVFYSFIIAIIWFFAFMRFWALRKRTYTRAGRLADITYAFSLIVTTTSWCLVIYGLSDTQRVARMNPTPEEAALAAVRPKLLKMDYCETVLYLFQIWTLKFAFLFYFHSFFEHLSSKFRFFLIGGTVYCLLTLLVNFILVFVTCPPTEKNWNMGAEACTPIHSILTASVLFVTNVTSDLYLLVLATCIVAALKLGARDLSAVAFVFLLGLVTIITGTVRFSVLYQWIIHPEISLSAVVAQQMWATVEACAGNVAFCLPALRTLFRKPSKSQSSGYSSSMSRTEGGRGLEISVARGFKVDGGSETELVTVYDKSVMAA